jgi:hypothetical protein
MGGRGLIPGRDKRFSFSYRVQTGSGAHPPCHPMGIAGPFAGDKVELIIHFTYAAVKNEYSFTSTPPYLLNKQQG